MSVALISASQLHALAPNAIGDYLSGFAHSDQVLTKYAITTPLRIAHFMAQILHECAALTIREENLNYSAERMVEVWPSRFPNVEAAQPYAHNPQALANKVYNGRMGNATGSNDGWNFRGRGLLQITGRDAYEDLGNVLGIPLAQAPSLASGAENCVAVAAAEWTKKGCNALADADDLRGITRAINGGLIGYNQRLEWLRKTRAIWVPAAPAPAVAQLTHAQKLTAFSQPFDFEGLAQSAASPAVTKALAYIGDARLEYSPLDSLKKAPPHGPTLGLKPVAMMAVEPKQPSPEHGLAGAVAEAPTPAPAPAKPAADDSSAGLSDVQAKIQQSFVVGQQLISFDETVNADYRRAALISTLFAQLNADAAVPRADGTEYSDQWYAKYRESLVAIGWDPQGAEFTTYSTSGKDVEVDKAIIDVVTGVMGAASTAIAAVTALLTALKNASSSTPFLTLFNSQSHTQKTAQFQVSIGTQTAAQGFVVASFIFTLTATETIDQILLFKWSSTDATFKYATWTFSVLEDMYKAVEPALLDKLKKYSSQYIQAVTDF
jgi:putative chitinase